MTSSAGETRELSVGATEIADALLRIRKHLAVTPLTFSPSLSELLGIEVYCKWDNRFRTGSFKERGAVNVLSMLSPREREIGVCAASAGNHALAMSYHAARFGVPCTVVMPRGAPLVKLQSTRDNGARVVLEGQTIADAYEAASALVRDEHLIFIPGFDDPRIIAGQGTCGLEILEQLSEFDAVVAPIGGGGLMAGLATAIKLHRPSTFILGVQTEWAVKLTNGASTFPPELRPLSLADGIALKIGKVTAPYVQKYVDKIAVVSEGEISRAIVTLLESERTVVEGAGAAALAGVLAGHLPPHIKRVVVVVCGSNIDINALLRLMEFEMGERGRLMRVRVSVPDRPGSLHATTGLIATEGANVLQVFHDRSFSFMPGNVDITFLLEVRNSQHKQLIIQSLTATGVTVTEIQ